MENIIFESGEKFKEYLREFIEKEDISVDNAELFLTERINSLVCSFLGTLYEQKDAEMREDKEYRKREGLTVERRDDKRNILSLFGDVRYGRTYYKKASGGYEYPVDSIVGIEPFARISEGCCAALVDSACYESYALASHDVVGGNVSKQTVMNKIRMAVVPERIPAEEKRKVPVLHVDADEDHVPLQNGKKTIVMTATMYEGVERVCKGRNKCINAESMSRYNMDPEEFWEEFYDMMDAKYDLDNVKIYLHADAGEWIQEAFNWFPSDAVFVLDWYHVNQRILEAVSGIPAPDRDAYMKALKECFKEKDSRLLAELKESMISSYPERCETIADGIDYLLRHFDAIHIRYEDENATGGSSEPHVQHLLSHRLSSVPMGWSKETLEHFAPILTAKCFVFDKHDSDKPAKPKMLTPAQAVRTKKLKNVSHGSGLMNPGNVIFLPTCNYKKTRLGDTLRALGRI